jgi:5-methylcytosine-specific restriction endonuclease McrA
MADENLNDLPRTRKEALERGSKWFFNGAVCKNGHVSRRSVAGGCCRCNIDRGAAWVKSNPEKRKATRQKYRQNNLDKERAISRQWHIDNPERTKANAKSWRAKNEEKHRELNRAWRLNNPERTAAIYRRRRSRSKRAQGSHTASDINQIRKAQKDKCAYCGAKLKGRGQVDHIIALAKGGEDWPRNLQLLCAPCNQSKGARDPIDFSRSTGKLI